jgi:hypothetical protein
MEITMGWSKLSRWVAILGLLAPAIASGDAVFITGGNSIYRWDTGPNTVTPLVNTGFALDSLIFDANGNIISSRIGVNQLGRYNFVTDSTFAASGLGPGVADMALEPGGATLLVGNAFGTTISRVNASTGGFVTDLIVGARPDGIAYDGSGNLFVVLGRTEVAQVNASTGAVIKSLTLLNAAGGPTGDADGLTFDSTTGKLYVSNDTAAGGYWIVSPDLLSQKLITLNVDVDGLAAAGNLLYLIQRGVRGLQVDLTTDTISLTSPGISGADDIAPLSGLGSQPVPEPATVALLGLALAGVGLAKRRERH